MNISQVLKTFHKNFKNNKIPNSQLEAEILLSDVLKKPREFLLAHPEFEVSKAQAASYELRVARRLKGEPIAYIMGHKEFYGLDFFVNKNVLIPRPETEMMVEEAVGYVTQNTQHATVIDVGTGSGCVIISLVKKMDEQKFNFGYQKLNFNCTAEQNPDVGYPTSGFGGFNFFGIDISKPALAVARKNAKLHGADKRIKFLYGNLLEPILKCRGGRVLCGETLPEQKNCILSDTAAESSAERLCRNRKILHGALLEPKSPLTPLAMGDQNEQFIITANLPYLTPAQVKNSPTIQYEPRLALTAGPDGLKYYRQLFKQISCLRRILPRFSAGNCGFSRQIRLKPQEPGLKPGRSRFTILCEIDPSQAAKIKQLVKKELPESNIEIKKDLAGRDRLVIINL